MRKLGLESHPRCIGCTYFCAFLSAFVCLQVFISVAGGKTLGVLWRAGTKTMQAGDRRRRAVALRAQIFLISMCLISAEVGLSRIVAP